MPNQIKVQPVSASNLSSLQTQFNELSRTITGTIVKTESHISQKMYGGAGNDTCTILVYYTGMIPPQEGHPKNGNNEDNSKPKFSLDDLAPCPKCNNVGGYIARRDAFSIELVTKKGPFIKKDVETFDNVDGYYCTHCNEHIKI